MPYGYKFQKDRAFDFDLPEEFLQLQPPLQIWAMDEGKFSVNQIWFKGSLLVFRDFLFEWNVEKAEDIREHHLELCKVAYPKLDYIIIGTGKYGKPVIPETVKNRFKAVGINVEYCATFEACGTFNLASEDMRHVCAGLIPSNVE
jgi:NADH dehydrogenase [ubiquinone] 1 alpha subcomplex assembly factor 3